MIYFLIGLTIVCLLTGFLCLILQVNLDAAEKALADEREERKKAEADLKLYRTQYFATLVDVQLPERSDAETNVIQLMRAA